MFVAHGSEREVVPRRRAASGEGALRAEHGGEFVFLFDNTFSWVLDKTVALRLERGRDAPPHAAAAGAATPLSDADVRRFVRQWRDGALPMGSTSALEESRL